MHATLPLYSAQDLCSALRTADPRRGPPATERLDRPLACEPSLGKVEVQAATSWARVGQQLAQALGTDALAFAAAYAPLGTTVGEAVAALPPLPDATPFADAVESLALVTADGELRCASRSRHAELFRLVLGGHGSIAAPYSVTLRIPILLRALEACEAPVEIAPAEGAPAGPGDTLRLFVPPERLSAFVDNVRLSADDFRAPLLRVAVRRALPDPEPVLAWATQELAVVDLCTRRPETLPARATATQLRKAWIDHALSLGGSFDLSTGFDASREQVEAGYPRFSAFLAEARRLDPHGRLAGRWLRHYAALFACGPVSGRWSHA